MASAGIKTRICMISDTHTFSPVPAHQTDNPYRVPLPKADVLIHSGDLTKLGYRVEHQETVSMLKAADAELKLVIAGNHDLTLDEEYFTSYGYRRHRKPLRLGHSETPLIEAEEALMQQIRSGTGPPPLEAMQAYVRQSQELYTNQSARDAGIRFLDEGVHTFVLSTGAKLTVYASPYQPEFWNWAFGYPRTQDRFNPPRPGTSAPAPANPVPDFPAIDIMFTHGPPAAILDAVGRDPVRHVGCQHLLRAAERARPRVYSFGHIHEGWGAIRGAWNSFASGGVTQEVVATDEKEMCQNHGAFYDVSSQGPRPLKVGEETLFVNASICTLGYAPTNAPWVVDLDLPATE